MSSGTFEGKFVIDKLTGSNCGVWSTKKVKIMLMKDVLWRLVGGTEVAPAELTEAYTRRFVKATATVGLTVDDSFSLMICDYLTLDLWTIENIFGQSLLQSNYSCGESSAGHALCQMVAIVTRHQRQFRPGVECKGFGRQWVVVSAVGAV